MRTTKDMDYIFELDGTEILIEAQQKDTRNHVIEQYVKCRKEKKMTQEQLSQRTGISRPNISRFESGNYNPSLEMMVRIAEALGMNLNIKLESR
ncbi:MAG: helix-turn-helix transcriptional regulator [Tyzzerella sp.]|nr:helix-turn-helix transcriptional regulator [Tyzzerella sp.]